MIDKEVIILNICKIKLEFPIWGYSNFNENENELYLTKLILRQPF